MSGGERPIAAAKGTQSDTEASRPPLPLCRHGPVQAPERALNGCVQDLLGGRCFVWS